MDDEEKDPGKIKRISGYDLDVCPSAKEIKYRKKYLPDLSAVKDVQLVCSICMVSVARDVHGGKTLYEHPHLHVLICKRCHDFYEDGNFSSDEDGDDKYCRWCGQGGTLYVCTSCTCAFCDSCLDKNIKPSVRARVEDEDWKCFICAPRPLYGVRTILWAARSLNDIGKERARVKREREQKKSRESSLEISAKEQLLESSLSEEFSDEGPTNKRRYEDGDSDSSSVSIPVKKKRQNGAESLNLYEIIEGHQKQPNDCTREADISEEENMSVNSTPSSEKENISEQECHSNPHIRGLNQEILTPDQPDQASGELEFESDLKEKTEKIKKLKLKINKLINIEYEIPSDNSTAEPFNHEIKRELLELEYINNDPANSWIKEEVQLNNVEDQLNDEYENQLRNVEDQLGDENEGQLRNEEDQLDDEDEGQLRNEEDQLGDEDEDQLKNEEDQLGDEDEDQLRNDELGEHIIKESVENDWQNDDNFIEEEQASMDIKEEAMSDGYDDNDTVLPVKEPDNAEKSEQQIIEETMSSSHIDVKIEAEEDFDQPVIDSNLEIPEDFSIEGNKEIESELHLPLSEPLGDPVIPDKDPTAEQKIDENVRAALIWMNDIANDISEIASFISARALKFGERKVNLENLNSYEDVLATANKLKEIFVGIHSHYASIEENLESKFKPWKILTGLEYPDEVVDNLNVDNCTLIVHNNLGDIYTAQDIENITEVSSGDSIKNIDANTDKSGLTEEMSSKGREMVNILKENDVGSEEFTNKNLHSNELMVSSEEKCMNNEGKDIVNSNGEPSINDKSEIGHNKPILNNDENLKPNINVNDSDIDHCDVSLKNNQNIEIENKCNNNVFGPNEDKIVNTDSCKLEQNEEMKVEDQDKSDKQVSDSKTSTEKQGNGSNMSDSEAGETDVRNKSDEKAAVDPRDFEALQQMLYSSSDNEFKDSNSDESEDVELEDSDIDILKPAKKLTTTKRPKKKVKKGQLAKMDEIEGKGEVANKRTKNAEEDLDSEAEIDMLTDLSKLKKKAPYSRKFSTQSSEDKGESSDDDDDDDDSQDDQKESLRRYIKKNNEIKKRREEERKELFGFLQGDSSSEDELDISKLDLDMVEDGYGTSSSDSMTMEAFSQRMNAKWKELDREQEQMNLQLLLASDSELEPEPGSSGEDIDIDLKSDNEKKKKKAIKESSEGEISKNSDDEKANKEKDEKLETDIKAEPDLEYEQFLEDMSKSRTTFKGIGSSSDESGKDDGSDDDDDDAEIKKDPASDDMKKKKESKGSDISAKSSDSGSSADLFVDKKNKKVLNKTWRNHKLLRIKLSDTDTSDEERWWQRRLDKEKKKKTEEGNRPKKPSGLRKKKKSSDKENKNKLADNSSSTMELSSTESSGSSIFKKKKRRKGQSSDSDIIFISDDDKKKKKKRKRGDDSSDESNDSGNDVMDVSQKSTQGESPGKGGRKNIRKVLTKHELAAATKAAAKEEEERKKRIAARQKMFNEIFEIKEAEVLEKLVLDFDPETKTELISVDKELVTKMKPHQAKGVKFMWDSCFESLSQLKTKKGSGCILAHCMGLGKTFQVISLVHTILKHEDTHVKSVLVVCPLSTVLNWYSEFGKWLDDVRGGRDIKVYHLTKYKQTHERARLLTQWQRTGGVMIIGYELFRILSNESCKKFRLHQKEIFKKTLLDPGADLVVCDEGHMLKNESTVLSKAMSKIKTLRRIVLTGTPMQNNLKEYHCMVQFVKPNLLGTRREFLNQFVNPITNGQFVDSTEGDVKVMKRRAHVLHKMLEGLVQRFDYSVLTPFLPPKHEYVISVRLSEVQVKLYQFYLENFSQMGNKTQMGSKLFTDWQALGRIWTHPLVLKMSTDKAEKEREKQPELVGQQTLFDVGFKSGFLRSGRPKLNTETEEISDSSEENRLEESEEEESVKDSSSSLSLSSTHSSSSSDSDEDEAVREKRREARKKKKLEKEFKKLEHKKKKLEKQQKKLEKEQNKPGLSNEKDPDKSKHSGNDKKVDSNLPDIEAEINLISSEEEEEKKQCVNEADNNTNPEQNNVEPLSGSTEENSEQTPVVNSEEENVPLPETDSGESPVVDKTEINEENESEGKTNNETGELENDNENKTNNDDSELQLLNDTDEGKAEKEKKVEKVETVEELTKKSVPTNLDSKGSWWKDIIEPQHLEDINQSAKLILLFAILRECELIEDKVLVFSQSLFSLDLIEHFLEKVDEATKDNRLDDSLGHNAGLWTKGLDYFRLDGSSSSENRSVWCKAFNREDNPRARLFLISTRAGGLGINLTGANRVIIFDASWNPSHDVQSIFRIFRFGQKKACYVYRFIAHGTMEEKVYERQVAKQSLSSRVVDEQQVHRHFSMNDLSELYRFTPPSDQERPTPALPRDRLMAELLAQYSGWIEKYHEHDSLLENVVEEELNEEERKLAWEDFENDKKKGVAPPGTTNVYNNPMATQIGLFRKSLQMKYPNSSEAELNAMLQTLMYQVNVSNNHILQTTQGQGFKIGNQQVNFQNKQRKDMTAQQSFNMQRNHLLQKWGQNAQLQGQNQIGQNQNKAGSSGNYMDQMRAQQEANLNRIRNQTRIIQGHMRAANVDNIYPQPNRQTQIMSQPPPAHQSSVTAQNRQQTIQNRPQAVQNRQQVVQNRQQVVQNRQQVVQNRQQVVQNRQHVVQNRQQNVQNRQQQAVQNRQPQPGQSDRQNRLNRMINNIQKARNVISIQQNTSETNRPSLLPGTFLNNGQLEISPVSKPATTVAPKVQMRQEEMRKRVLQLQLQKQMALQRKTPQNVQPNGREEDQKKRLEEMKNRYKASRKNLPHTVNLDAEVVEIDDEPSKPSRTS